MEAQTKRKLKESAYRIIEGVGYSLMWFGFGWIAAWIFKPNLSSATVSFFLILFASIMNKTENK